jgi:hypothetical protein
MYDEELYYGEDGEAICRMMEEAVKRDGKASERLEERYVAYIEIPDSWLNIRFDSPL